MIALILLTRGGKKYPYILNGLLLGAAVGCSFSAFESVQYALDPSYSGIGIIFQRALLSPFTHIVWTALAGAALWRVQRGGQFRWRLSGMIYGLQLCQQVDGIEIHRLFALSIRQPLQVLSKQYE